MEQNGLFITNDCQVYGQVRVEDAESTIKSLNKEYPNLTWRVDTHEYLFCSNPSKDEYGMSRYSNPNRLVSKGFCWITCMPEIFECDVIDNNCVTIDPGLFNCVEPNMIF